MKINKKTEIISLGMFIVLSVILGVFRSIFLEPQLPGDENFGTNFSGLFVLILIGGIFTLVSIFFLVKSKKKNKNHNKNFLQEGLTFN